MLAVVAAGYPLICGRTSGIVKVAFPAAVRVPAGIPPRAVRLNGAIPERVDVLGRTVTILLPRPRGTTCDSITVGRLTVTFTAAAHVRIGAARTAVVTHGTASYRARISP